jgi:hypothetical protein
MGVLLSYANLYRLMLSHTHLYLSLYLRGGILIRILIYCLRKIEISIAQLAISMDLTHRRACHTGL